MGFGEIGSGESTLLSLICGIVLADEGSVSAARTDLGPAQHWFALLCRAGCEPAALGPG